MAELRRVLGERGYFDVATILQSGNVLLTSDSSAVELTDAMEQLLADDFGVPVRCVVRTAEQVRAVLDEDPLAAIAADPARYLVSFLSAEPASAAVTALLAEDFTPEVLAMRGSEAYVWTPDGAQAMKLSNIYLEKRLGVAATARNWNTVRKIVAAL